jgi:hypothetical protein
MFGIERSLFVNKYGAIWKYPKFDQATRDDDDDYVWTNDISLDFVIAAPQRCEWLT